jgi:hypothetical protein
MQETISRKTEILYVWRPGASLLALSHSLLTKKYAERFNFYLSKSINEILGEVKCPAEIVHRDWLYYDDCREITRRYYRTEESEVRLMNYTVYYSNFEEFILPCFQHLHVRKIMFKRRKRMYKLNKQEVKNGMESEDSQKVAMVERNKNFLRRLGNPTIYLDDLYMSNSAVEKQAVSLDTADYNLKKSDSVFDPKAEIHDIYNPVFSSDEEQDSNSFEEAPMLSKQHQKANKGDVVIKMNRRLNVSNKSITTKISEFEQANESIIKTNQMSSCLTAQQSFIDIIYLDTDRVSTKKQKKPSPALSQRCSKQSSEITKATFLNFKKNEVSGKEEIASITNITRIMQDHEKHPQIKLGPKKDKTLRLGVSPKNPPEITHLRNS